MLCLMGVQLNQLQAFLSEGVICCTVFPEGVKHAVYGTCHNLHAP